MGRKQLEEIFNKSMQKNMIRFNLTEFKRTHFSMYKGIIEAMEQVEEITKNESN